MNVVCTKKDLLKGLSIIESGISSHVTLPILSNFLFEAENKKIKLASTNLEIGVKCYIDAKITSKASITLPARKFLGIIRELSDKEDIELKIDTDKNCQCEIKSGKSRFLILGTPKEEFPALPEFADAKSISIDTAVFEEMVRKTMFSVSKDDSRPALTGIYFVIENDQVKFVATDGRRLAVVTRKCEANGITVKAIVLPKVINELIKIIGIEKEEKIKMSITENQVGFKIKDIILISRLVEGNFPNYEQVIPRKNPVKIKVNADDLLTATKQMAMITTEKGGSIKYLFTKNVLRLSAASQGIGSGEVDVDIEFDGPNLEIAFSADYVIDVLKNVGEKEVLFELNGPVDAAVSRPVTDENYTCVIMPVRIM